MFNSRAVSVREFFFENISQNTCIVFKSVLTSCYQIRKITKQKLLCTF